MSTPKVHPVDIEQAIDARVITPSDDPLNPLPRALFVASSGDLYIDCPDPFGPIPVYESAILPLRPLRIRPATTATIIALY